MIRGILLAAAISSTAIYPVTAFSKSITCEHDGWSVRGRFISKGDDAELVKKQLGTAFQVDTTEPNVVLIQLDGTWYTMEGVSVSQTKNFTIYKYISEGKYTESNERYKKVFSFRVYRDGWGLAAVQHYPSSKYARIEARGKCDNL